MPTLRGYFEKLTNRYRETMNRRVRFYFILIMLWILCMAILELSTICDRNARSRPAHRKVVELRIATYDVTTIPFENNLTRNSDQNDDISRLRDSHEMRYPDQNNTISRLRNRNLMRYPDHDNEISKLRDNHVMRYSDHNNVISKLRDNHEVKSVNASRLSSEQLSMRKKKMINSTYSAKTLASKVSAKKNVTRSRPKNKITMQEYLTPRTSKVNQLDAEFLISNENFCNEATPFLLVMVPSIHRNAAVRDAIRNTYGSYKQRGNLTVKLVFLFGTSSESSDRDIQQESIKYGDIIQADFTDSYKNLTYKILYGLKWVSFHCSQAKFVLKADEDVFVHMPVLLDFLRKTPYGDEGAIYGYVIQQLTVQRSGKWAVTHEQFPFTKYPPYVSGTCYVISGNVVSKLVMTSEYMPYISIEDAFVTGFLGKIVGIKLIHSSKFSRWKSPKPKPCSFVRDRQLSSTKTDLPLFFMLWEAINSYEEVCLKKKTRSILE